MRSLRPHFAVFAILFASSAFSENVESSFSIQPYGSITTEGWSLIDGGAGSGERAFALIDFGADFTVSDHTVGHVGAFVFGGDRDVDTFTGDFGIYSSIITDSRYILFTAWLEHEFGASTIRYGQLASDETFYAAEGAGLFINANFGPLPTVAGNAPVPAFSVASAGVEFVTQTENGFHQIGVYAGDPGPGDRDDHGLNWKMGGDAGYFMIAEKAWRLYPGEDSSGSFKLGTHYHSGQFESLSGASRKRGNFGYYAITEFALSETRTFFARIGTNEETEYSIARRYFDCGFNWTGVIENRPEDQLGIAYTHTSFSDAIGPINSERVVELTYAANLDERMSIQPSIQYIANPINTTEDAWVAGIRFSIER